MVQFSMSALAVTKGTDAIGQLRVENRAVQQLAILEVFADTKSHPAKFGDSLGTSFCEPGPALSPIDWEQTDDAVNRCASDAT